MKSGAQLDATLRDLARAKHDAAAAQAEIDWLQWCLRRPYRRFSGILGISLLGSRKEVEQSIQDGMEKWRCEQGKGGAR